MAWTNEPPTRPDYNYWAYWRKDKNFLWKCIELWMGQSSGDVYIVDEKYKEASKLGGEWWDTPVPAPGTTWSVPEIQNWMAPWSSSKQTQVMVADPVDGIAAVTERNNKEPK